MLVTERYAAAFAEHIFKGDTPAEARGNAANDIRPTRPGSAEEPDDKTLQDKLRGFFNLRRLPRDNAGWLPILENWIREYSPQIRKRYPKLRQFATDLEVQLEAISRNSTVR
jgi:hypothetical protein